MAVAASSTVTPARDAIAQISPLVPTAGDLSGERLSPRPQVDNEVALERVGDAEQRVDSGWATAPLEPCDRGLGRADELGKLALREPLRLPAVRDLVSDR